MARSQEDKALSHERIVQVSSAQIRRNGITAPAVAAVMREAGLTHGGFYKHFNSRDDLIAEAVAHALADGEAKITLTIGNSLEPVGDFIDFYTADWHRDNVAGGCALVSLADDVARSDGRLRGAYGTQVERYLQRLQAANGDTEDPLRRRRIILVLSSVVGAVLMARAVGDNDLSDELLRSVADELHSLEAGVGDPDCPA